MRSAETRVYADAEELAAQAAAFILALMRAALEDGPRALVVLSGGTTPRECYRLLAGLITEAGVPLERLVWAFGDERWVPVSHPDSNEGMARGALLDPIGAPEDTILSWQAGSGDPVERAAQYREKLHPLRPWVVLQGLGADGHTASLYPGALALLPDGQRVPVSVEIPGESAAVWLPSEGRWRLTLCPAYLNRARTAVFLVTGEAKRASLARALAGDPAVPGSWVRGQETVFLATRDALAGDAPDFPKDVRFA
jgi:6-phosphogluconolactonase